MKSLSHLVLSVLLLATGCSDSDDGGVGGGMFVEEPSSPCRRVYDSIHDACIDELSATCIGFACLFIFGECQSSALREASLCCANSTASQDQFDACFDPVPGANPP